MNLQMITNDEGQTALYDTCTQLVGHVEQGKPHICPECGAWILASERAGVRS